MQKNITTTGHKHSYHLVDPSPWPLVSSLASLVMATGGVLWMHDVDQWVFIIGLAMLIVTAYLWWRDVVRESRTEGVHNPVVRHGLRVGMILFIVSEVMFFVAFFWAYFHAAFLSPSVTLWPPQNIITFDPFHLPYLNTLLLLLSGTTVTWAHHALLEGNRKGLLQGLGLTVLLGLTFTVVQGVEYAHAAFAIKDGIYPSTFYLATGFHGAHVIIGTIFLIVCWVRAYKNDFTADHHVGFEAAAWYWHFVDVVWLFLFISIYWWSYNPVASG